MHAEHLTMHAEHWDAIFRTTTDAQLGWYEENVAQTLKFLDRIPAGNPLDVFLPGAGTSGLVDELLRRGHSLVLNDISLAALDKLQTRLGGEGHTPGGTGTDARIQWLHHDISKPLPAGLPPVHLWLDRAVLHFLLLESDIQAYFDNLRAVVAPGGHVLLAEFSTDGAKKCAGLELHRYSTDEMAERLGAGFELLGSEAYTYTNPNGDPRPYIYALFRRRPGSSRQRE